jgi:ubiquitin carboxyl-terminal hydrolase 25/28
VLPESVLSQTSLREAWRSLGLTALTYSWGRSRLLCRELDSYNSVGERWLELLSFGYMAQCRCDPANTPIYFTNFYSIVKTMQDLGHTPPELQAIVVEERGRYRHTLEDQQRAISVLGFGKEGHLRVEFESDIPEQFIADAWRDLVRRAWRDTVQGAELQREANEAFRIVAEARGSVKLWQSWESGQSKAMMNPDRAYDTLEIPKEVDDAMLLTVFMMRVCFRLLLYAHPP